MSTKKKKTPRKLIQEATKALRDLMQEGLAAIGANMVEDLIRQSSKATDAQAIAAVKDLSVAGVREYKRSLMTALAVIVQESVDNAKKELPGVKTVKFMEVEDLHPKLRRLVKVQTELYVADQISDLKKHVGFQFMDSLPSTDSVSLLKADLEEAVEGYVTSPAITAGAGKAASSMVNTARQTFFNDDEVVDQIGAWQFVNGDPVTDICTDLDGKVFSKDDPEADRFMPPLHWNCKSYIIPILPTDSRMKKIERLDVPSKLKDQIQFSEPNVTHSVYPKCLCGCG